MRRLGRGDGEGARLQRREKVEQILEGNLGSGEGEIVENLETIAPNAIAVIPQILRGKGAKVVVVDIRVGVRVDINVILRGKKRKLLLSTVM